MDDAVTYLGDGLYAEYDGHMIRLYTQDGNNVWLEPEVWRKLTSFVETHVPAQHR